MSRPHFVFVRLAQDFGVPEDAVRGWHCLVLIRRGHDVLGEEAMSQVGFDFRQRVVVLIVSMVVSMLVVVCGFIIPTTLVTQ